MLLFADLLTQLRHGDRLPKLPFTQGPKGIEGIRCYPVSVNRCSIVRHIQPQQMLIGADQSFPQEVGKKRTGDSPVVPIRPGTINHAINPEGSQLAAVALAVGDLDSCTQLAVCNNSPGVHLDSPALELLVHLICDALGDAVTMHVPIGPQVAYEPALFVKR
jgi:hypothetical protein